METTSPFSRPARDGKDRLLRAALTQFTRQGFDGTSIREIGREAGLSNPALYRHYASKEALGLDLYRQCYRRVVHAVVAAADAETTPLGKIGAYARAQVGIIESEPEVLLYVDEHQVRFWPVLRPEFEPRTLSGLVAGWVAQGRADGSIDDHPPASAQAALVLGTISQWAAMRGTGVAERVDGRALADVVRGALITRIADTAQ